MYKLTNAIFTTERIPEHTASQYAFIGRSNVGKSSLINALTKQPNLCRTSKQPGRTQQINFFQKDQKFIIVDLPGYGYAAVAKYKQKIWHNLLDAYFNNNANLKMIFVLIDARRGLMDIDKRALFYLKNYPITIVLTKADKVKDHDKIRQTIQNETGYPVIVTSSAKMMGIEEFTFIK